MKKYFKRFAGLVTTSAVAFVLLAPTLVYAFTPTFNEFPTGSTSSGPFGITTGPDGNLWFTERQANDIGKITTAGVVTEYPLLTSSADPFSITAGPDGNLWFTETAADKIGRITPAGVVTEFSVAGGSEPFRITAGSDGNLWFTDYAGDKMGKITTSGVTTEFNVPTPSSSPDGITLGPDGNVWFAEANSNTIGKVTPGGVITEYPVTTGGSGTNVIAAGPDGNIWFSESGSSKIGKMTLSGTFTDYPVPTSGLFYEMTAGPDGNVWYTLPGSTDILGRVTPSGTVTEYTPPTANGAVSGITAGPDGNIWFGEQTSGKIGQLVIAKPPAISSQSFSIVSGTSKIFNLIAGIANNPSPSTLSIVSGPSHGTAIINTVSGTITYASTAGYVGNDSITYRLCSADDTTQCKQAVLSLTIVTAVKAPDTGFGIYQSSLWQSLSGYGVVAGGLLVASLTSRKYLRR
jgi:streptogramin lyase